MYEQRNPSDAIHHHLRADCANCFGLCCVALPYAKSADFPFDKDGGSPCRHLQNDFRCRIHASLRNKGFRGCTVYECFGAGQKVSQITYKGEDWKHNREIAEQMFVVLPIMQQLHEMLYYIQEARQSDAAQHLNQALQQAFDKTMELTYLSPTKLLELDVPLHRAIVNELLIQVSDLVRDPFQSNRQPIKKRGSSLIGAKLKGVDWRGVSLRGEVLIAADLRGADLRAVDFIGADLRDADLSGANLVGSIFLTQAQINSAKGDTRTKLPATLQIPKHWLYH
ncbi:pentapeptide repeat-containing protein [Ornithinibacillus sp. BX22]|uniref:Pentapeptide repeat-containing protein n=1 Tax=Ornithinibacillus hominis TaxID=2763055 RepID=A0A923L4T6_9BACI|nr:pentapeptide repeat-containing protein [Ornithinibacillus hominis]MBC5636498.1 pentapeptide repeat-containing protein [Ornithinibacillus hominis]